MPVIELGLSVVRLMNDRRFPWLLVIPARPALADLTDLGRDDRIALSDEVDRVARVLKTVTGCSKLNIAALGNMVAQLHVHVIARFRDDTAWPGPVWGVGAAEAYPSAEAAALIARLAKRIGTDM